MKSYRYILSAVLLSIALVATVTYDAGSTAAPNSAPEVGDPAPTFHANDHRGELWSFDQQIGDEPLVLYFYPAAMTRGCTKQACSYRDNRSALRDKNIRVVGISGDPVRNLTFFREKHDLNFTLLSDPDASVARKFGVPTGKPGSIERTVDNQKHTLVRGATFERWTFVIDRNGKVAYVNRDVTPQEDSENVLDVIQKLGHR